MALPAPLATNRRSRGFPATLNNYTEGMVIRFNFSYTSKIFFRTEHFLAQENGLKQFALTHCKAAIIAHEVGEQGTPHLQMFFYFKDAKTFTAVRALINMPQVHIEVMNTDPTACWMYCRKEDMEPWIHGSIPKQGSRNDFDGALELIKTGIDYFGFCEQYPDIGARCAEWFAKVSNHYAVLRENSPPIVFKFWQEQAYRRLYDHKRAAFKTPDDREILWIWSDESATGKTEFMKHLSLRWPGRVLCMSTWDIAGAINLFDSTHHNVIWFNIPRAFDGDIWKSTLETLSDRGIKAHAKYHGAIKTMQNAHIVVTANFLPEPDVLPVRVIKIWAQLQCYDHEVPMMHDAVLHEWQNPRLQTPAAGEGLDLTRELALDAPLGAPGRHHLLSYMDPSEESLSFLERCQQELWTAFQARMAADQAGAAPDGQDGFDPAIGPDTFDDDGFVDADPDIMAARAEAELDMQDQDLDVEEAMNTQESFEEENIAFSEGEQEPEEDPNTQDREFIDDEIITIEDDDDESEKDIFVPKRARRRIESDDE